MARPVWTGVLSFGLVSIPVALYTATDSHTIHFHQLQRGTSDRIRNRRVNERTGKEVELEEIVKGYDTGEEYVLVEPEELEEIAPGRSKTIEISGFVDLDTVDPIFFDKTYYLGPKGKEYSKVYGLLEQALEESSRAGIATFVMRGRECLLALKAEKGLLAVHTLHWSDEIRDPHQEIPDLPKTGKASAGELKMAHQLIDALAIDWQPKEYDDVYQEKVAALIEAKQAGETVEKAEPAPKATGAVDLMEALRASVERARSPKDTGEKASTSTTRAKSAGKGSGAAKKRTTSSPGTSRSRSLESLTKAELYEKATKAGIRGRSGMSHDELADALAHAKSS
ncbi:non-homologous end joining protein Ku [Streptomyces sp. NBC_01294]|uniref:non-homologous end joining protein Ku n=1 Tax=Streptomyces sp. NBC_01294 TaxID=2903815 RepID=UPI002DD98BF0|nr:Ku protein [Streptomyces sp. NBC_01294]WRZ62324.1 Ku protein [Streptomyces sp. NBC_01294]